MSNWDLADMMQIQTWNNLANIPNEIRQNQYVNELCQSIDEQNDSIERQNQYIRDMQAQYENLKSKFYELMDDRDGWQAQEHSLRETAMMMIENYELEEHRDEINAFRRKAEEKHRKEVRIQNGRPVGE